MAAGFPQIKLKVGADLADDIRRCAPPGRWSARTSASPSTPTSAGTSPRRSAGSTRSPSSTRTGSRSRPAPTTSSGTPRSAPGSAPIKVATGEHVQNRDRLQAAAAGRRHRRPAARRDPGRRGQREPRDPAAGRQVRRAGLPARRRRRAVRAGPAPVDVRLRRGLRQPSRTGSSSTSTTCTSTSSTRSVIRDGRYVAPDRPRLLRADAPGIPGDLPLSGRRLLGRCRHGRRRR